MDRRPVIFHKKGEDAQDNAGSGEDIKCPAPAHGGGDSTACYRTDGCAQRYADVEDAQHAGALFRRVGGTDHGHAARGEARFTNPYHGARDDQGCEALGEAGQEGEKAPEQGHDADGPAAAPAVDQVGHREGEKRHAQDEERLCQAALSVGQPQFHLHGLQDRRETCRSI